MRKNNIYSGCHIIGNHNKRAFKETLERLCNNFHKKNLYSLLDSLSLGIHFPVKIFVEEVNIPMSFIVIDKENKTFRFSTEYGVWLNYLSRDKENVSVLFSPAPKGEIQISEIRLLNYGITFEFKNYIEGINIDTIRNSKLYVKINLDSNNKIEDAFEIANFLISASSVKELFDLLIPNYKTFQVSETRMSLSKNTISVENGVITSFTIDLTGDSSKMVYNYEGPMEIGDFDILHYALEQFNSTMPSLPASVISKSLENLGINELIPLSYKVEDLLNKKMVQPV